MHKAQKPSNLEKKEEPKKSFKFKENQDFIKGSGILSMLLYVRKALIAFAKSATETVSWKKC